jgi:CubicO group peptidase (beta-lactamase class C family)
VTEALDRYVDEGRLPGAVVHVVRRGRLVYSEAVGHRDVEAGSPMTTDAIFRIASQTKAVVSVAVMMLQEDGRLLISDPVSKHLPAYSSTTVAVSDESGSYDVVAARRPVTIRDLLTHTSGVSYGSGPGGDRWEDAGITGWYFAHRDEPVRATVDRMASLPFTAQPGERWVYGYGTDILGAVVEAASGEPLDEFLRTRILEPLDMTDPACRRRASTWTAPGEASRAAPGCCRPRATTPASCKCCSTVEPWRGSGSCRRQRSI